ncbi:HNH endonuclease [Dietzia sp. 179-F 9C3 NHS]|uniref:HNH endonuclease n=1 Tax=Dietzia sp. 179-F 9C3 NHS TaxID=3374295 RepID=UPI0038796D8C
MSWGGRKSQTLRILTLATHGDTCHLCGAPGATTADHVVPRALGGPDTLDNLRPAHAACNSSRGKESVEAWRERRGIGGARGASGARAAPRRW